MTDVERDEFGAPWYQGRPKGRFWLAKEFHLWPEIRTMDLNALGAYFTVAGWAAVQNTSVAPTIVVDRLQDFADTRPLFAHGLVRRSKKKTYRITTMGELRHGRGARGLIMRLSRHLPDGMGAHRAGLAAMGVWALAASWSLNGDKPGYVPTDVAVTFGGREHVAALWDAGLWIATEFGFLIGKGDHPYEALWELGRDDERAAIPIDLRTRVFNRDGWKCVWCSSTSHLSLDHIIPWSHGGPDTYENLRVLCRSCNSSKGARRDGP